MTLFGGEYIGAEMDNSVRGRMPEEA